MKLKKFELREENTTMSVDEMKNVFGGQVIDPGNCALRNGKCSGGCAIQYAKGGWTQGKCTMFETSMNGMVIHGCSCI